MSEWPSVPFGRIAKKLVNGGTPPTDVPRYWIGHIPWVTGADFTPSGIGDFRRFVSAEAVSHTSTNVIQQGQLLLVTRTGVGKLAIAPCDIAISQDITGVYVDEDLATTEFIFHRMRQGVEDLKKLNQGTSINGIIRSDLVSYPVELPPLTQQRRIAEILTTLDEAIEQTEALIVKMQQVKAGLMHDLFTRGITPDGHLRPTREQSPELYKESVFGWIPKEWDVCLAEKICYMITKGATPAQLLNQDDPSAVPFIRVQNLTFDGSLLFDEDQSFIPLSVSSGELARSRVLPGDVLMNIVGPPLGKVSVIPDTYLEWNINQAIAIFRPIDPSSSKYLSFFLLSNIAQDWFLGRAKRTSGQVNLTLEMCRQLPIPIPRDTKELKNITCLFASIDDLTNAEKNFLNKLKEQKQGILHDLLTGYVKVKGH